MKNYNQKELSTLLGRTIELIANTPSDEYSAYACLSKEKIINRLERYKRKVDMGKFIFKKFYLKMLFAPTSDIQEISMSGGWSEEYIELSTKFDNNI